MYCSGPSRVVRSHIPFSVAVIVICGRGEHCKHRTFRKADRKKSRGVSLLISCFIRAVYELSGADRCGGAWISRGIAHRSFGELPPLRLRGHQPKARTQKLQGTTPAGELRRNLPPIQAGFADRYILPQAAAGLRR